VKHIPPDRRSTHELYEQFRAAGERKAKADRALRRRAWFAHVPGPALGAVLAFLVVGGGVAVGTKVFTADDDAPLKGEPRQSTSLQPAANDRRLAQAVVADPKVAGARWAMLVYPDGTGATCATAGRLIDGRVGRVVGGRFRAYPDHVSGAACSDVSADHATVTERYYSIADERRTLLFGVVDRTVTGLSVEHEGTETPVAIAADGTYLAVGSGDGAFAGQRLKIVRGSAIKTIDL
jgi:hypothetical protein